MLWDRAPLWLGHLPGAGQDLVIAFSSIGHDPARLPAPEFRATATAGGRPALFVADASRSWANAPDFAPALRHAVAVLRGRQPIARIVTLGLSMGGFCALAAAEVLAADCAIAISPQFSVDPARMPDETPLMQGLAEVWAERRTRVFTLFIFLSMVAYFLQELILEPYAGLVFNYTPGQSTQLSGVQHGGVFLGMVTVGIAWGDQRWDPANPDGRTTFTLVSQL